MVGLRSYTLELDYTRYTVVFDFSTTKLHALPCLDPAVYVSELAKQDLGGTRAIHISLKNKTKSRSKLANLRLPPGHKRQRHDPTDMHVGPIDMQVQPELGTDLLDVLETLLVVWPRATHPDGDLVLVEQRCDIAEGADDALERGGYVCKVGDAPADEEHFALRVLRRAQHQVQHRLRVLVRLRLRGRAGVLAVVCEFPREPGGGDGVRVDDRRAAAGDEGPHAAGGVEDGELEGGAGLGVEVRDEGLLLGHLAAEWRGELHGGAGVDGDFTGGGGRGHAQGGGAAGDGPLDAAFEFGRLVELGCQVEEVDLGACGVRVGDDD